MARDEALFKLIGQLHDTATDTDKWGAFVTELVMFFCASSGHLVHYDFQEQRMTFSVHAGLDHMSAALWMRYEALLPGDPRMPAYAKYIGKPQSCRMTIDEQTLHASRMYREVLVPARIEYTLGLKLDGDNNGGTGLAIMRNDRSSPFDQADCDLLGKIIPHPRRALELHKRFALLDFGQRMALEALDRIATGIVLLEEGSVVKFANRLARDIAGSADGFRIMGDSVMFADYDIQTEVIAAARGAIASARADPGAARQRVRDPAPIGRPALRFDGQHPVGQSSALRSRAARRSHRRAVPERSATAARGAGGFAAAALRPNPGGGSGTGSPVGWVNLKGNYMPKCHLAIALNGTLV